MDLNGRRLSHVTHEQWERVEGWRFYWSETTLKRFLARNPNLVLFGASDNMFDLDLAPLFDRRVFLLAPWSVIRARLNRPTRDNDWGRDSQPRQREWVRNAVREWPARAHARGFEVVDASLSPDSIFVRLTEQRRGTPSAAPPSGPRARRGAVAGRAHRS